MTTLVEYSEAALHDECDANLLIALARARVVLMTYMALREGQGGCRHCRENFDALDAWADDLAALIEVRPSLTGHVHDDKYPARAEATGDEPGTSLVDFESALMADYRARAKLVGIPEYMIGGLQRWIVCGTEPGSFLRAVLEDRLVDAFETANTKNQGRLKHFAEFMVVHCPRPARGADNITTWKASGGLVGQERERRSKAAEAKP